MHFPLHPVRDFEKSAAKQFRYGALGDATAFMKEPLSVKAVWDTAASSHS